MLYWVLANECFLRTLIGYSGILLLLFCRFIQKFDNSLRVEIFFNRKHCPEKNYGHIVIYDFEILLAV